MRWTRGRFRKVLRVYGVINLLLIITLGICFLLTYVFGWNNGPLPSIIGFAGVVLFALGIVLEVFGMVLEVLIYRGWQEIKGVKAWQVKEERFGVAGTLVRITVGVIMMFGLIYLIVHFLSKFV